MRIKFIEIQNFRKLKAVRVDFSAETTVFVGANNSGKTSAMVALHYFLVDKGRFTSNDFTLSCWSAIDKIGDSWAVSDPQASSEGLQAWETILPSLDVWLHIEDTEIHYVSHLLPTLDWTGGLLGVRLRFEPKDIEAFYRDFITAKGSANRTVDAARQKNTGTDYTVALWPATMCEFLERRLNTHFTVRAYSLDPAKQSEPENGVAHPQPLPIGRDALSGDPFNNLILIHEVSAQRGFSDASGTSSGSGDEETPARGTKRKLSEQLSAYYTKHIDPTDMPEPSDVEALQAILDAQIQFNRKLTESFGEALNEVANLGYPGITDLKLALSTRVKMLDGLNHPTALQYQVESKNGEDKGSSPCLPEHYNGLGYQNLISMVFLLMSFRDHWMQVGKARKRAEMKGSDNRFIPPLHLVLVEEPEAHLHVQVQQVFIRKAYEILQNHLDLKANPHLKTQLVVTTHSSHIAHESKFSSLRYFRRRPPHEDCEIPTSTVVNLSEFFGSENDTQRFVTRYLKTTHCDLFFADAAILVEGPAERVLVPHFIREHFTILNNSYITILEIGGSHAHRLRNLIEHLGLLTLIIADIDAASSSGRHPAEQPVRLTNQITRNSTLKSWVPAIEEIDRLLDASAIEKIKEYDPAFAVRAAYQCPVQVEFPVGTHHIEALANTFEDALVFNNLPLFSTLSGEGLIEDFTEAVNNMATIDALGKQMFALLKNGNKAEFALNILYLEDPGQLNVPLYIHEGLLWLQERLQGKHLEMMAVEVQKVSDREEVIA